MTELARVSFLLASCSADDVVQVSDLSLFHGYRNCYLELSWFTVMYFPANDTLASASGCDFPEMHSQNNWSRVKNRLFPITGRSIFAISRYQDVYLQTCQVP